MASFRVKDGFYTVSRHACEFWQYLGLKVTDREVEPASIIVHRRETDEPNRVSGDCVRIEVVEGLSKIQNKLKRSFFVNEIEFRGSDSPQPGVYVYLTLAIIFRKYKQPSNYDGCGRIEIP